MSDITMCLSNKEDVSTKTKQNYKSCKTFSIFTPLREIRRNIWFHDCLPIILNTILMQNMSRTQLQCYYQTLTILTITYNWFIKSLYYILYKNISIRKIFYFTIRIRFHCIVRLADNCVTVECFRLWSICCKTLMSHRSTIFNNGQQWGSSRS